MNIDSIGKASMLNEKLKHVEKSIQEIYNDYNSGIDRYVDLESIGRLNTTEIGKNDLYDFLLKKLEEEKDELIKVIERL